MINLVLIFIEWNNWPYQSD